MVLGALILSGATGWGIGKTLESLIDVTRKYYHQTRKKEIIENNLYEAYRRTVSRYIEEIKRNKFPPKTPKWWIDVQEDVGWYILELFQKLDQDEFKVDFFDNLIHKEIFNYFILSFSKNTTRRYSISLEKWNKIDHKFFLKSWFETFVLLLDGTDEQRIVSELWSATNDIKDKVRKEGEKTRSVVKEEFNKMRESFYQHYIHSQIISFPDIQIVGKNPLSKLPGYLNLFKHGESFILLISRRTENLSHEVLVEYIEELHKKYKSAFRYLVVDMDTSTREQPQKVYVDHIGYFSTEKLRGWIDSEIGKQFVLAVKNLFRQGGGVYVNRIGSFPNAITSVLLSDATYSEALNEMKSVGLTSLLVVNKFGRIRGYVEQTQLERMALRFTNKPSLTVKSGD